MSDELSVRLLNTIQHTLKHHVKPQLKSSDSLINMDMSLRMLALLETRHARIDKDLRKLILQEREMLSDIRWVFEQSANLAMLTKIDKLVLDQADLQSMNISQLESIKADVEELVAQVIETMFDLAAETEYEHTVDQVFKDIIQCQQNFLLSQDPNVITEGVAAAYRGGRLPDEASEDAHQPPVDEDKLTQYLQQKFPDKKGIHAKHLKVIPGGFSKLTVFFSLCQPGEADRDLVMRKDMPISSIDSMVIDEYPLVCKVYEAGIPVPKPMWLETQSTFFDGAFIVSERAQGANDISAWQQDSRASDAFIRELAKLMADLHRLDIVSLGFPELMANKTAAEHMAIEIEKYYKLYKDNAEVNHPLMEIAFTWLKHNIPQYLYKLPPRIVHADIGFHNMLTENGKISAVLDWEMSHLGDPIQDLYYTKMFIEQVSDWSTFLDYYRSFGGMECPQESEKFYKVWMGARNAVGCTRMPSMHRDVLPDEIKLAVAGYVFGNRLQVDICNTIFSD